MRRATRWSQRALSLAVLAALAAGCRSDASLIDLKAIQVSGPCPSYRGGAASPTSLTGRYTVVSYCQNSRRGFGSAGSLILTASTDSLSAWIDRGRLSPVVLAGLYTLARDTITVSSTQGSSGAFVGTYAFSNDTLYVSGYLPDLRVFAAIIAHK